MCPKTKCFILGIRRSFSVHMRVSSFHFVEKKNKSRRRKGSCICLMQAYKIFWIHQSQWNQVQLFTQLYLLCTQNHWDDSQEDISLKNIHLHSEVAMLSMGICVLDSGPGFVSIYDGNQVKIPLRFEFLLLIKPAASAVYLIVTCFSCNNLV